MADAPRLVVHPGSTDISFSVVELAGEVAARGLHGIYLSEHTHIPVGSALDAYPLAEIKPMPERYKRLLDPFIALAIIGALTPLELGTSVCLPVQHDAIALAKTVATLDHMTGGRVVLGVGFGWNRQEIANHGVEPASRADVLAETVTAMKALWQDEVASFAGRHVSFTPSWQWPKPAEAAHPPVLLGARGTQRNFDRIVTWADGWLTMEYQLLGPLFVDQLERLRRTWASAGRDGAPLVVAQVMPAGRDELSRMVERAAELEVSRLNVVVEDHPRGVVCAILDDLAAVTEAVS